MARFLRKVDKFERAGKEGKELICPKCKETWLAGHFDWIAFTCNSCKADIDKLDWLISINYRIHG